MGMPFDLVNLDDFPGAVVRQTALDPEAKALLDSLRRPPSARGPSADIVPVPPEARGRRRVHVVKGDDGMNKTERAYSRILEERKHAGELWDYIFEPANFRLGERCFYRPDFLVFLADGSIEVHETKGFMEEDALVKIRAFVAKFHIPLVVVRRRKGRWDLERFEACA